MVPRQGTTAIAAENTALAQLAAEGITVTASSGDSGANGDGYNYPYNVSDPAAQPYITGVGGTTLRTGAHEVYVVEEGLERSLAARVTLGSARTILTSR
jgi:subtilase family serine protease